MFSLVLWSSRFYAFNLPILVRFGLVIQQIESYGGLTDTDTF